MKSLAGVSLALRVLAAEGPAALRDRLLDRAAGWRRRRRFRLVTEDDAAAGLTPVPVLNVMSTPPRPDLGGVQVQLLRRLAAEGEYRPRALLYPEGGAYRLEVENGRQRVAVELWDSPPPPERLDDPSFERAVRRAARWVDAEAVHFEQLVGWPLGSVCRLAAGGLRTVISVHDFGLFCLRPHLVERPALEFCDYSRDAERCARCLRCDWDVRPDFQQRRRRRAAELLAAAEAVIYPSDFLRRTYLQLVPGLDPERQHVVEPPSAPRAGRLEGAPRRRRAIRHVAYVGSVQAHKGAPLFEQLVRRFPPDEHPRLRWSVYGGGDAEILARLRRLPAVRVRGYYRADRLPQQLARERVDLALLLSIWPEAYALTFDECLRAGVPALAFDHGAIADRLHRLGGGALVEPAAGVEGLEERLRTLLARAPEPAAAGFELPDGNSAARTVRQIYRRLELPGI